MFKLELFSPAGTLKNVRYASAYDADTVYTGQPHYPLCVYNNEFNHESLQLGISGTHVLGKESYVMINIASRNAKLRTFIRSLKPVTEMGLDALVMSDPGLVILACEHFPGVPIHLLVRTDAVNRTAVEFWQQVGLTRMVFSRGLSLKEIGEIRNQIPDMGIEASAHGALCMVYSGRCLFSGYINKCSPNQGTCTNTCRWKCNIQKRKEDDIGNIICKYESVPVQNVEPTLGIGTPTGRVSMIEEAQHLGEYMAVFGDEHGTYVMNSKNLRAVTHVEHLTKMSVHSLEAEGHTKSFYYCVRTAQAYYKVIDDAAVGRPFNTGLLGTLEGLARRGYTRDFLHRHIHDDYQNHEYGYPVSDRQQFADKFAGECKGDLIAVMVKDGFSVGDSLELMTPQGDVGFTPGHMGDTKSEAMSIAPDDGCTVWLPVPQDLELNYTLLMRNFSGGTTHDPHDK